MHDGAHDQTAPPGVITGRQRRLASPIPLVDLAAQHRTLENALREALTRMLDTSAFILGEEVEAFEREFAEFCGVRHAVGVGSGLEALTLSLSSLGIGRGDEVILPANAFIATALAVTAAGAKPVLVDVDPERYTMDPGLAARAVTRKTKALLPVHLYGQPADMAPLKDLAEKKHLVIVEDACQAHGALLGEKRCGALADAGCFSFYPSKNLGALGDGGMVVTDDDDLAGKLRQVRNYGQAAKNRHPVKGVNSRLDAFQAAVLRVKLRHLPKWNESRRRHAGRYAEGLASVPLTLPAEAEGATHVYNLFVVRLAERDALLRHLEDLGVSCGVHYPVPIHRQEAFSDLGLEPGAFPVTERLAGEILSLPMYPELSSSDIDRICEAIAGFYAASSG
ncbi:MAG TPA: DegT/DnrJ/EryC1/StrS family aminotransferase [Candidatus Saccharimonadales bacterium]|nr:DegT/DnrJ/EryC1/StrS family aminotransferase [Candidatus Saccharimonadales bacterium]